ncbi:hypothetical protein [Lysobacter sp. F60174L2]
MGFSDTVSLFSALARAGFFAGALRLADLAVAAFPVADAAFDLVLM